MKNNKKGCGVYAFLETTGLLEKGSESEIEEAKKSYWTMVRKEWKRDKRAQCKSVTVFFTAEETSMILKAARRISLARYVKDAALAYGNKRCVIDKVAVGEIRQELIMHYMTIQTLMEENKLPKETAIQLLQQVSNVETKTMQQLKQT